MRKLAVAVALASTALASPAMARDNSWYVGVGGGVMIVEDIDLDIGTVADNTVPDFNDIKMGAGVGLRYMTPFGPLRLDVAVPLDPYDGGSRYAIYAGIGQSF